MEEGYDRELQVDMWALQWQKVLSIPLLKDLFISSAGGYL